MKTKKPKLNAPESNKTSAWLNHTVQLIRRCVTFRFYRILVKRKKNIPWRYFVLATSSEIHCFALI